MDELNKVVMNEIDDDELDMVAGGCGHEKSNGKGHTSHGNGKGLGHEKKGCGCDEEEEPVPASSGITFTCPHCGQTYNFADVSGMTNHLTVECPKKPC